MDPRRDTLVHQLAWWAATAPDRVALRDKTGGTWRARTWAELWEEVRAFAKGLLGLGHQVGDCVAIVGANRIEWLVCELGIMALRGVPAPIYTTNTPEQMAIIVRNSRARIAIADTAEQLGKYREAVADGHMQVDCFVTFDEVPEAGEDVTTVRALVERGRSASDEELDERIAAITTDETALLIYTSGTTGVPKGVMLEHGGLTAVAEGVIERLPRIRAGEVPYRAVSYLPLCHAAEQLVTTVGLLQTGGEIAFCADLSQIKDRLVEVRPTLFLGVPRVWEKFEAALRAKLAEATGFRAWLVAWARRTELAAVKHLMATGRERRGVLRWLANRLVTGKIRAALGLDQLYMPVTGAAPISVGTLEFFASLGITIYEAYGMSETSGVCTFFEAGHPRFGRVGGALEGVEIRIADDGEVQLRGRIMTRGYLHMPEETAALYTEDGWLRTGDVGDLDADGYLGITGRLKELLITAGGKNVAPAEMEAYMQRIPGVAQAVVVGDRKPYLCALVTVDPEALPELEKRLEIPGAALPALTEDERFRSYLQTAIDEQCNAKVARYQTIKKFTVLPGEFSIEGGELTPTMKLRRKVILERHADAVAAMYES